ncbi:hypothetical protein HW44_15635 [Nitrosococcus oceani]|nr:hypothetical protein HW44_15635 [Nitrosococcus oceani]
MTHPQVADMLYQIKPEPYGNHTHRHWKRPGRYDAPQRACEVKRRAERKGQDYLRFAMNSRYDFLALGA